MSVLFDTNISTFPSKIKSQRIIDNSKLVFLFDNNTLFSNFIGKKIRTHYNWDVQNHQLNHLYEDMVFCPDIIIVDPISINPENPYKAIKSIQNLKRAMRWDVPVIVMSHLNNKETIRKINSTPGCSFISKSSADIMFTFGANLKDLFQLIRRW